MKPNPSHPPAAAALFDDSEPTPLPAAAPPPLDFEDDHYFDDDEQPSWWSSIRPVSALHGAENGAENEPRDPLELPPLRPRTRAATGEVLAATRVLRVRAQLAPDEQYAFDELMNGPAATDIVTMLVNRDEDDAIDKLRRRLADEPTVAEIARSALAAAIADVSPLLSEEEEGKALASLASLWPEELIALAARLADLSPIDAAALIQSYLSPRG
jgi:hypothetical protein